MFLLFVLINFLMFIVGFAVAMWLNDKEQKPLLRVAHMRDGNGKEWWEVHERCLFGYGCSGGIDSKFWLYRNLEWGKQFDTIDEAKQVLGDAMEWLENKRRAAKVEILDTEP